MNMNGTNVHTSLGVFFSIDEENSCIPLTIRRGVVDFN